MHILTGSRRFRARETSGGYKHPERIEGLVPSRFVPGAPAHRLPSLHSTGTCMWCYNIICGQDGLSSGSLYWHLAAGSFRYMSPCLAYEPSSGVLKGSDCLLRCS